MCGCGLWIAAHAPGTLTPSESAPAFLTRDPDIPLRGAGASRSGKKLFQTLLELGLVLHDRKERPPMTGIQFVTDEKGRKLAVQIDLKRYGAVLEDFWDGMISESRRKEKGRSLEKIKGDLVKRGRLRG